MENDQYRGMRNRGGGGWGERGKQVRTESVSGMMVQRAKEGAAPPQTLTGHLSEALSPPSRPPLPLLPQQLLLYPNPPALYITRPGSCLLLPPPFSPSTPRIHLARQLRLLPSNSDSKWKRPHCWQKRWGTPPFMMELTCTGVGKVWEGRCGRAGGGGGPRIWGRPESERQVSSAQRTRYPPSPQEHMGG